MIVLMRLDIPWLLSNSKTVMICDNEGKGPSRHHFRRSPDTISTRALLNPYADICD